MATRKRRTQKELFLDGLLDFAGGEDVGVSNSAFRSYLDWDQKKYNRVKKALVDSKLVLAGRGKGGTVRLPKTARKAAKVFISYSHADKTLKQELLKHLMPLKRLHLIKTWTDLEINPGDEWDKKISQNLDSAEIVLLLISIDFINSEYCFNVELQQAIARHKDKQTRVIPVILRPCMWKHTPFAKFQALPR